jgi:hypothetical protein
MEQARIPPGSDYKSIVAAMQARARTNACATCHAPLADPFAAVLTGARVTRDAPLTYTARCSRCARAAGYVAPARDEAAQRRQRLADAEHELGYWLGR